MNNQFFMLKQAPCMRILFLLSFIVLSNTASSYPENSDLGAQLIETATYWENLREYDVAGYFFEYAGYFFSDRQDHHAAAVAYMNAAQAYNQADDDEASQLTLQHYWHEMELVQLNQVTAPAPPTRRPQPSQRFVSLSSVSHQEPDTQPWYYLGGLHRCTQLSASLDLFSHTP